MSRTKIKSSDISDAITIQNLTVTGSLLDSAGDPITGGVTEYATIDDLPLTGVSNGAMAFVNDTNYLYIWADTGWYQIGTINTNPSITGGYSASYKLANDATGDTPPSGGGTATIVTLVGSDPEGIPITWSYEVTAGSLGSGSATVATVSQADNVFTITPYLTAGTFTITWKASDGVNIGTAVSGFSLQFEIADSKYTSLLMKGLATGANATFVDSSANNFTITKNGDTTQGTFSPFSQPEGAWSNYFDGTGDYLSVASSSAVNLSSGVWTIECYAFWNGTNARATFINKDGTFGSTYSSYNLSINGGNYLKLEIGSGNGISSVQIITSSTIMPKSTWVHIAAVFDGSLIKLYQNGTLVASATKTATIVDGGKALLVGYQSGQPTDSFMSGYISSVRIIKGTALYSANFTPPAAPLTAVTNTSLLTCQSNRFIDNSANAFAATPSGNVAVSPFSPFDRTEYDPAVHGGSAYFDGTGDYLRATSGYALGSGDFTIEMWVFPTSLPNAQNAVYSNGTTDASSTCVMYIANTGKLSFYTYPTATEGTALVATNRWSHIAAVRNSGTIKLYVNGVQGASFSNASIISNATNSVMQGYGGITNSFIGYVADARVASSALYTAEFTPPTAPLTAVTNTQLLLNCTNADIIDNDSKNNLKLFGNTAVSTTTTKYAAGSVYFDGTGDYVTPFGTDQINFGTGDFTIEAWIYANSVSGIFPIFGHGTTNSAWWSWYLQNDQLQYYDVRTGVDLLTPTATFVTGQWYHLAVVRSGSTFTQYINGVADADTGSSATAMTPYAADFHVGRGRYSTDAYYFNGYIEDFRITKGLARYTANFTPPTSELLG